MTEDVKINITANTKGLDTLQKEIKSTGTELNNMKNIMAGFATGAAASFLTKSIMMGAELQVLKSSFAGTSKDIDLFRKSVAGTVTDGGLIKLSNYASDLGVSLQDQAKLFSLAEDAADKYGGGVESNFERIINATDGSQRGLRAVGISTKAFEDELDRLTKTTGRHIEKMSADEQLSIRLEAIFNLTGTTLDSINDKVPDTMDKIDGLKVSIDNLTSALGEGLASGIEKMVSGFNRMTIPLGAVNIGLEDFMRILGSGAFMTTIPNMINNIGLAIERLQNTMKSASEGVQTITDPGADMPDKIQLDQFGRPIFPKGTNENATITKKSGTLDKGGSKGSSDIKETTEVTNELIDKQKQLNELLLKEATFTSDQKNQKVYLDYLEAVKKLKSEISLLQSEKKIFSVDGVKVEERKLKGSKIDFGQVQQNLWQIESDKINAIESKSFGETASQTLEDTNAIYGAVTSTMSVLNIGTDSFVGKLLGGFGAVLTVMESIKAVNSILSFIPGFATGGDTPAGMPYWVGEHGKELRFDKKPGYIMNHTDSMKYMNNNNNSINLYMSGNIDVTASLKAEKKKYNYIAIK